MSLLELVTKFRNDPVNFPNSEVLKIKKLTVEKMNKGESLGLPSGHWGQFPKPIKFGDICISPGNIMTQNCRLELGRMYPEGLPEDLEWTSFCYSS